MIFNYTDLLLLHVFSLDIFLNKSYINLLRTSWHSLCYQNATSTGCGIESRSSGGSFPHSCRWEQKIQRRNLACLDRISEKDTQTLDTRPHSRWRIVGWFLSGGGETVGGRKRRRVWCRTGEEEEKLLSFFFVSDRICMRGYVRYCMFVRLEVS